MSSTTASSAVSAPKGLTAPRMKRYTPPRPAPLPEDYDEFYASLTPAEKELDVLAKEMLGSSYIIQWTHMYLKWSKGQKARQEEKKE
jgi:hypothetical protein